MVSLWKDSISAHTLEVLSFSVNILTIVDITLFFFFSFFSFFFFFFCSGDV